MSNPDLNLLIDKKITKERQIEDSVSENVENSNETTKTVDKLNKRNTKLNISMQQTLTKMDEFYNDIKNEKKEQNEIKKMIDQKTINKNNEDALNGTKKIAEQESTTHKNKEISNDQNQMISFRFIYTMLIFVMTGILTSLGKVWGFMSIYHVSYIRLTKKSFGSLQMNFLHTTMLCTEVLGFAVFNFSRRYLS